MYSNKLVACLKANKKVLREFKDTVYMPYGTEYSIFLKNLNSVRALLNISIDGKDMAEGGLVINANSEVDLERSILSNNLEQGNRFKFIERTGRVEQHRGVKAEDGLVRISFKFEKPYVRPLLWPQGHWEWKNDPPPYAPYYPPTWYTPNTTGCLRGSSLGGVTYTTDTVTTTTGNMPPPPQGIYGVGVSGSVGGGTVAAMSCSNNIASQDFAAKMEASSSNSFMPQLNDIGITVPGSVSDQKFTTVNSFPTESEEHVIVLRILGVTEKGKAIYAPVSVKQKPRCVTCGHQNKATAHFCSKCGTALEVIA